jgi:hypothetical protein
VAERNEVVAVYSAGVIQGVALVTFPAASAIFSSPAYFRLSRTQYSDFRASDIRTLLRPCSSDYRRTLRSELRIFQLD